MEKTARDFVKDWNKSHDFVKYYVSSGDDELPYSIDIRFMSTHYHVSSQKWLELNELIASYSKGSMHVSTDYDLYRIGIIEVKINPIKSNYRPATVPAVLTRTGNQFFSEG